MEEQTGEVDDTQSGGRELCGYVNEVSGESGWKRDGIVCERVALFSLFSLCVAVERRGKNGPFSPYPSNVPFSAHDCERGLNDLGGLERERGAD